MKVLLSLFGVVLMLNLLGMSDRQTAMLEQTESTSSDVVRYSGVLRGIDAASLLEIRPPDAFIGSKVLIAFIGNDEVEKHCGVGPIACATTDSDGVGQIAIPEPCDYPEELYATTLCHEKGHTLGWPKTHGV